MIANQNRLQFFRSIPLFTLGFLWVASLPAFAQNVGDWETVPGLPGGDWDNSQNNSQGTADTWQQWNGSSWVVENGNAAGAGYPNNNSGLITILSGTIITNASASGSATVADGVVVQTNAVFVLNKSTFTLAHGSGAMDMDVFGAINLQDTSSGGFYMDTGATIVVEAGGTMTNFGSTSSDCFTGNGYGVVPVSYVPGAITFRSNGLFVLAATSNKGTIPTATWLPGSTCMVAPPSANTSGFIPGGLVNQSFYNFIWYWPTETGKNGGSAEGGSFTVNGNFSMTASPNGMTTNEDIPYSGNTLTVVGNIGVTNVNWFPTASGGTVTILSGGNFSVDSTATIKINSASALGNVIFNGTNGTQTLGFYGTNSLGSPGSWNWTVNSTAKVNLNSAMVINGGGTNLGGSLNINGTFSLTSTGALLGTNTIINVAQNGVFNVSQGSFTFTTNETLEGAGTIIGNVTAESTSVIYPGTGAPLTFQGNLAYGSGTSTNIFNLTSTTAGANDQIIVAGGTLTPNGAQIVINSAGTLATSDYVLVNVTGAGSISGAFNSTPAWSGTTPSNSTEYSIITSGKQVLLHYGTVTVPQPGITSVAISGTTNLTFNGTNAVSGTYIVLTSTNLASGTWTPVATNQVTGSGSFTLVATNAVNTKDTQQFYKLQAP